MIGYEPHNTVTITPNEYGPYLSVFTNEDKSRIGVRLLRTRQGGTHPTFWMDSRVIPELIEALKTLQEVV